MRKTYLLLLFCTLLTAQTAWADNEVVFLETFDKTNGEGGNDNKFSGSMQNVDLAVDNENWDFYNCYGAKQCLKFGSSGANGIFSTKFMSLQGTSATLTFKAAGWGDNTKDKLTVSAVGCAISGSTDIKQLTDGGWSEYTVNITNITGPVRISFSGKRGFIDDIKVTGERGGEIVAVSIPEPILTDDFIFWRNTIETTRRATTITLPAFSRVRYTIDGSEPTMTEGIELTSNKNLYIKGTTTIKAITIQSGYVSPVVSKTYTLGEPINSLSAFSSLPEGTEGQLFLSVEQNAKVTIVNDKTFTLLDEAGTTILFDFGTVAYDPTPVVGQIVAGWIVGKKGTVDGAPAFIATNLTTPAYMAFANPVKNLTGINATTIEPETLEYYTLLGVRTARPTKGIYITKGKKLIIH